jgi:elongation factor P--(R)-beta-lysine ligase
MKSSISTEGIHNPSLARQKASPKTPPLAQQGGAPKTSPLAQQGGAPKTPLLAQQGGAPKTPPLAQQGGAPKTPPLAQQGGAPKTPPLAQQGGAPKTPPLAQQGGAPKTPPLAQQGEVGRGLQTLRQRTLILQTLRKFFEARDFLEVDTPVAITAPAPEPHIEAVEVLISPQQRRFLQTSPELAMKRLIASGLERIFQLAPVFRDGDFTDAHRPEFRMLEWYRAHADWRTLLDDCELLLNACAQAIGKEPWPTPFRRITVEEAFLQHTGFSILDALDKRTLQAQLTKLHIHFDAANDTWDDLYHRVFLQKVEPALLRHSAPFFLTHYPAPLAALARLTPDGRTAERFELYANGLELANGFGELTDPYEQRRRFERDRELRHLQGLRAYPLDEAFLDALHSLPPTAGIALGFERLLMVLFNSNSIEEVAYIPWSQS